MVHTSQLNSSSQQATTTTSMYSVSTLPASAASTTSKSFRPRWFWSDLQYRELVTMYMNFVDHVESTTGTYPVNPHLNPALIEQVFAKFSRVAPRDCVIGKLKDCYTLEEEPYELAMNPMTAAYQRPRQINIRQRNQWDTLKVQRMKDQIAHYQHLIDIIDDKHAIRALISEIEERQRCLHLHPTRYYRPGP